MVDKKPDWQDIPELPRITCSSFDCDNDLHCFRRKRPIDQSYRNGKCVACGVDLIDWNRIDKRNLQDVGYTCEKLELEMIRHFYWHKEIEFKAVESAKKKGLSSIRESAEHRIRKYLGLPSEELFRDGTQTPRSGNVIFYAQHATASCCRKCAEEWHNIDRKRNLTNAEVKYLVGLIMTYVNRKLPLITEEGERTVSTRKRKMSTSSR